jgi:hypothetical protein
MAAGLPTNNTTNAMRKMGLILVARDIKSPFSSING